MGKENKKNILRVVLVFTIFVGLLLYVKSTLNFDNLSQNSLPGNTSISTSQNPSSQLHEFIQTVLDNKVEYKDSFDNVKYVTFSADNIDIWTYKYQPGNTKFSRLYEGATWNIDLSVDVRSLSLLKTGVQSLKTCATTLGCASRDVVGHKLGSRMWGSVDTYFQPAMSWTRVYFTYDKSTQQLVYVNVSFPNVSKQDDIKGVLKTHPEFQTALQAIEENILTF